MSGLEHERDRLISAVDEFLEYVKSEDLNDIRIDTFGIVSICTWISKDDEGEDEEREAPFQWHEARRRHVQIGVLNTCLREVQDAFNNISQGGEE